MADQDGRVAIVTGGAAGIGLATARRLASDGARVVCGDRDPVPAGDPAIGSFQVDLSSPDGPAALVAEAIRRHGRLDVLVNNVGMAPTRAGLASVTDADWEATFRLNLMCAVRSTRAALDELRRSPAPSVVFVASTTARVPDPYFVDYAASKAAVLAVAKALSEELGPDGIRVNSVSPGSIRTPLWDRPGGFTESITRRYGEPTDDALRRYVREERRIALGRLGTAEEVAAAIAFLTSADASYITGIDLTVDGGSSKSI